MCGVRGAPRCPVATANAATVVAYLKDGIWGPPPSVATFVNWLTISVPWFIVKALESRRSSSTPPVNGLCAWSYQLLGNATAHLTPTNEPCNGQAPVCMPLAGSSEKGAGHGAAGLSIGRGEGSGGLPWVRSERFSRRLAVSTKPTTALGSWLIAFKALLAPIVAMYALPFRVLVLPRTALSQVDDPFRGARGSRVV